MTTISEQECAIRAIIASEEARPGCNLERLKYADWLEKHGEAERARFIRLQCDYPHLTHGEQNDMVCLGHAWRLSWFGIPPDWRFTVVSQMIIDGSGPGAIVQRGFIDFVHVPTLETWRGGVCGSCCGSGLSEREYHGVTDDNGGCPDCHGFGRISGIGLEIARWNPVQEVRVGDREPWHSIGWCNEDRPDRDPDNHPQSDIPAPLFEIMERLGGYADCAPGRWLNYRTIVAANRYWSKALILEARQSNEVTE